MKKMIRSKESRGKKEKRRRGSNQKLIGLIMKLKRLRKNRLRNYSRLNRRKNIVLISRKELIKKSWRMKSTVMKYNNCMIKCYK